MATWTRGITVIIVALALSSLLASGCGGGGSAEGGQALGGQASVGGRLLLLLQPDGTLSVRTSPEGDPILLQSSPSPSPSPQIRQLTILLKDREGNIVASRSATVDLSSGEPQQIVLQELPVGSFLLEILAYDELGESVGFFTTEVNLVAGGVTRVVASLSPTSSPSPPPSGSTFLYVADFNGGTITGSTFSNGNLGMIPGSPFSTGAGPYQLATNPGQNLLFVGNALADTLTSYVVDPSTGVLTSADVETGVTGFVTGLATHPSSSVPVLYAARPSASMISAYGYDALTGILTPINFLTDSGQPQSIALDPGGLLAFGSDVLSDIPTYALAGDGSLSGLAAHHPVAGFAEHSKTLSRGGQTRLYTTLQGSSDEVLKHDVTPVTGLLTNDQSIITTTLPQSPGQPAGLDIHPTGNHLYVACRTGHIAVFDLDGTGVMTSTQVVAAPGGPVESVRVDPTGQYLLAVQNVGSVDPGNLLIYQILSNGQLSFMSSSLVGNGPTDLIFLTP